ncbi:MAG: CHAT domain-containing protein, partial [Bacteroidetes bacterium]|nr:CHAT domain-containing protein [Bacteroidota bacterium]
ALQLGLPEWGKFSREAAKTFNGLGYEYLELGENELALDNFQKALGYVLPGFTPYNNKVQPSPAMFYRENTIYESLEGKALAFQAFAQETNQDQWLDSALRCYQLITEVEDALSVDFSEAASKLFLAKYSHGRAAKAIKITHLLYEKTNDQAYLEKALFFIEHSKATVMREWFQEVNARDFTAIPDSIIVQKDKFWADANQADLEILQAYANNVDPKVINDFELKKAKISEGYNLFLREIETKYPEYYQLKHAHDLTSISELKLFQQDDSLGIVNYFHNDRDIFILIITNHGTRFIHKQIDFDLDILVENFRKNIARLKYENPDDIKQYVNQAFTLYQNIWEEDEFLPNRLLIIPDGVLNLIPFEALLNDQPDNYLDPHDYPYLLYKHEISIASSATVWAELQNLPERKSSKSLLAVTPENFDLHEENLESFPGSSARHQAIKNMWDAEILAGKNASEEEFKSIASLFKIIHLYTHAKANDSIPMLSSIFFQKDNELGGDQILHIGEILNLKLNAELVALPTCESLVGKVMKGGGINSLARAFNLAGARSMIGTLDEVYANRGWKIMETFYANLSEEMPKDKALRQAKLDFLKNVESSSDMLPHTWANYVLIGDASAISAPGKWVSWW